MKYHFYEPATGHNLSHDPFNAIIAPRPIGWISSQDKQGNVNLAPYSFFNAFNYTPPIIGFASVGYKDSLKNIEQTGEFCWNLVTVPLGHAMNKTSAMVDADEDEFTLAGLEKRSSSTISVPHVAESPVVMECRKTQIIRLTDQGGNACNTWMVFGEVTGVHIDKAMLKDGVYQTALAEPLMRGGGPGDYFTVTEEQKSVMMRPD
ncbi:flavin reductase family protein [Alteromonas sp. H39]|uniref:flavin reductase family protein n=1 Tax=Alteromonas sp. H39 TaxID=3389876 RepID=UPI0039DF7DAE